jgi:hypothetical protein
MIAVYFVLTKMEHWRYQPMAELLKSNLLLPAAPTPGKIIRWAPDIFLA